MYADKQLVAQFVSKSRTKIISVRNGAALVAETYDNDAKPRVRTETARSGLEWRL